MCVSQCACVFEGDVIARCVFVYMCSTEWGGVCDKCNC